MALLKVKDLSLGYDSHAIIEGLNFSVNAGDHLCIVGENGAGKSTLMKTLLHLKEPLAGQILYGDGLSRNEVGYLPQQTQVQKDFPASVYEIVLSGNQGKLGRKAFYSAEDKKRTYAAMERLGIGGLKKRSYRELSGGQQQRVLLARALCATERLLLLDEPVSGLDPKVTLEMYELIEKLNATGITIIEITHDIRAALQYASHILYIGDGVFFGTKEEYAKSEDGQYFLRKKGGEG